MLNLQFSRAENLGRTHHVLLTHLQRLQQARSPRSFIGNLSQFLETVEQHFQEYLSFLEQDGYLDQVVEQQPRLDRKVQGLRKQHYRLVRTLNQLVEEAREGKNLADKDFREGFHRWVDAVHQHSQRETTVVAEAFNQDIGAED